MHYLVEDPWPLTIILGLIAVGSLIALKVTQQGKFLVWATVLGVLALVVLAVEALWVTDNERIEAVVYDLARAVSRSDPDAVEAHLAPEVTISQGATTLDEKRARGLARLVAGELIRGNIAKSLIRSTLDDLKFDVLYVGQLETNAGALTRQGTAEFRVYASGSFQGSYAQYNFATDASGTDWSLGFRETEPGVWKVTRITPIRVPGGIPGFPGGGGR